MHLSNTKTPNNPGITVLLMMLAPYAAANAGAVPLAPMLMAKNIASKNGIVKKLKSSGID